MEFFPASIATIIRYLEAEISRGTWKSVSMNGIDWPSPAEALNSFVSGVKEVLEHVGVHIESWHPGKQFVSSSHFVRHFKVF